MKAGEAQAIKYIMTAVLVRNSSLVGFRVCFSPEVHLFLRDLALYNQPGRK